MLDICASWINRHSRSWLCFSGVRPNLLREYAVRYHSIYGVYGISVFAISGVTLEEMAQQFPLVRVGFAGRPLRYPERARAGGRRQPGA